MKRALLLIFGIAVLALAGCATVAKVDTGERTVGDRLILTLDGAWNEVSAPNMGPAHIWTMEGLPIDQLLVYSGLKDGQAIHAEAAGAQKKPFVFHSSMQADEIAALFEGMLTRDGSVFKLTKLEPARFGEKGFHFEFALTRKVDNVQLLGLGYACVSKGELFALLYQAPRLTFFARQQARVQQIAESARLKI